MKLVVDVHETRTPDWLKIEKYLLEKEIDYEVKGLKVGDFVINDAICFERKSISDFYKSIRGDHLWRQTRNMRVNYEHNFVIISGDVKDLYKDYHTKFIQGAYLGALASLAVMRNMNVVQVDSPRQLIDVIIRIADKIENPKQNLNVQRIHVNGKDVKLNMIMCVPKIGLSKAKLIGEKYSIAQLIKCSKEDLLLIKGIGPKQANAIKEYFSE